MIHYIIYHKTILFFFKKLGRKGISFQTLMSKISIGEDINNILAITNEVWFCLLSVNSLLNSDKLVLYCLMRATCFIINVDNCMYQLHLYLKKLSLHCVKIVTILFSHSDVINYITHSDDIITYRHALFYDIVKRFCQFNAN